MLSTLLTRYRVPQWKVGGGLRFAEAAAQILTQNRIRLLNNSSHHEIKHTVAGVFAAPETLQKVAEVKVDDE